MTDFLCGFIRKPFWEEETVSIEKQNLIDQIKSRINDKRRYALYRLTEEMCREEAYSIDELGIPEVIEKITSEELLAHHKELLQHAQVLVTCIGRMTEQAAVCLLYTSRCV